MKTNNAIIKVLSIFSASLIFMLPTFAVESQKTMTIQRVADGSVIIDAVKDDIYNVATEQDMSEQNLTYFSSSPEDTTGKFITVYDSNYIYLYAEVSDSDIDYSNADSSQTWNRESIGVMLDFSYNRSENYEYSYADNGDLVCYINLSGDGVLATYHMYASDAKTGLFDKISYKTISDDGKGKIIYEIAMPFPSEVKVAEKLKFGMEVLATNAEGGTRVGVISWSPDGSEMWHYSDVCGTALLGAPVTAETVAETAAETAAPDTAAPVVAETAAAAPQTGSNATIAVAVMAIAASAAIYAIRKKQA
jgi:Domain of unknown function (DUF1083).